MRGQYSILVLLLSVVLLITGYLVSCKENEIKEAGFPSANTNIITLTQESLELINPRTEKVGLRSMPIGFTSSGRVGFNEKKLVHITSRVSGWVEKVYVFAGDEINSGDTLVSIYSPEFLSAQAEFIQAEERLKSTPMSDSIEYHMALALYQSAKAKVLLFGATEGEAQLLANTHQPNSHLVIRSPLSGTVIESNIIAGNVIEKGANLFRLSDLSSLWITAYVYEKDIGLVKKGQEVEVISSAPQKSFLGRVEAINEVLDETTRTFKVRITVDNSNGLLKPEMFCQCQFKAQSSEKLLTVPLSAVQTIEGEKYVFLPQAENSFEKRAIKTGRELGNYVQVLEGLKPGEEVVTEGSFVLKSELLKAQFGEE